MYTYREAVGYIIQDALPEGENMVTGESFMNAKCLKSVYGEIEQIRIELTSGKQNTATKSSKQPAAVARAAL